MNLIISKFLDYTDQYFNQRSKCKFSHNVFSINQKEEKVQNPNVVNYFNSVNRQIAAGSFIFLYNFAKTYFGVKSILIYIWKSVAPHFEKKSRNLKKKIQNALNFGPHQRTLKRFFEVCKIWDQVNPVSKKMFEVRHEDTSNFLVSRRLTNFEKIYKNHNFWN